MISSSPAVVRIRRALRRPTHQKVLAGHLRFALHDQKHPAYRVIRRPHSARAGLCDPHC